MSNTKGEGNRYYAIASCKLQFLGAAQAISTAEIKRPIISDTTARSDEKDSNWYLDDCNADWLYKFDECRDQSNGL